MVTWFQLLTALKKYKPRSAWDKGVRWYAIHFIKYTDDGWHRTNWSANIPDIFECEKKYRRSAKNWKEYSEGGYGGQFSNYQIAKRLSSPSEFKRFFHKDGFMRESPNPRESWCDVEGRAMYQAWDLIKHTYYALNGGKW